jgi:hypothetical protein
VHDPHLAIFLEQFLTVDRPIADRDPAGRRRIGIKLEGIRRVVDHF